MWKGLPGLQVSLLSPPHRGGTYPCLGQRNCGSAGAECSGRFWAQVGALRTEVHVERWNLAVRRCLASPLWQPQPRPGERDPVPSPARNRVKGVQDLLALPPFSQCYVGFAVPRDISMTCLPLPLLESPPAQPWPSQQDALEEGAGCGSLLPAPSPSAELPMDDSFTSLPAVGAGGAELPACAPRVLGVLPLGSKQSEKTSQRGFAFPEFCPVAQGIRVHQARREWGDMGLNG